MSTSPHVQSKEPQVPFVDLSSQYNSIAPEINEAISRVLRDCDFILGREVKTLEEEFAAFCEAEYAVAVDSGTSALELALRAYGIGPGDEVITAANTFIATALAISQVGATPVFADVDPRTYTIDVQALERAITSKTKAIIPVHLYGHPADMDAICAVAKRCGLIVVEDACQAHGALYKGKRVGSLGHVAAFSFYPGKNLGAYGDGGMVVTNDRSIAERLEMLRNYGQKVKYHHLIRGFNRRLDTLQAAVLRVKLKYLEKWNTARQWNAAVYTKLLQGSGVVTPSVGESAQPVWHLYVIRTPQRDLLMERLVRRGIAVGIHYPIPIHLQPAYQDLGYKIGDFPIAERFAREILSLPMYAELEPDQIEFVCKTLRESASAVREVVPNRSLQEGLRAKPIA